MIKRIFIIVLSSLCLVAVPAQASAYNFFLGPCSSAPDSPVCQDNKGINPLVGSDGLILKIADIVAIVAGIAAVIMLLISGLRFITSDGDPEKAKGARRTATGALVGIVVIALTTTLIDFVLSKL